MRVYCTSLTLIVFVLPRTRSTDLNTLQLSSESSLLVTHLVTDVQSTPNSSENVSSESSLLITHLVTEVQSTPNSSENVSQLTASYGGEYDAGINTSTPPPESVTVATPTMSWFKTMKFVLIPIFFVVGIIGNTLSVIIMLGKDFRIMTSSLIIIVLALVDSAVLVMQPFNNGSFIKLFGVDIRSLSNIGCKVFSVLWRTSKMSAAWLVVLISSERFVAVWFPLHVKLLSTKRNIKLAIICIFVSALAFTAGWSFSSQISEDGLCTFNYAESDDGAYKVHAMLITGTLLCGMIPTLILPVMATAITCRLYHHKRMRKHMPNIASWKDETQKATAMLLSVPVAFIFLVSPTWIGYHVSFILGEDFNTTQNQILKTWRQVAQPLEQLNYSINFMLYVAFSKLYRTRLVALFTSRKAISSLTTRQTCTL